MEIFGKVPLRGLAHPPGQRQGTTFINDMDHQRGTPASYAAAIHDKHHRLQGEMTQQNVRRGQKVHLLQDMGVVEPSRKAFDAAFRFGAIGYFRRDVRQLGALAAHDAADERRKGDRKSTRLNSSHLVISYAVFCLKKKKIYINTMYM